MIAGKHSDVRDSAIRCKRVVEAADYAACAIG